MIEGCKHDGVAVPMCVPCVNAMQAELTALREVLEAASRAMYEEPEQINIAEEWQVLADSIARARAVQDGAK